MEKFIKDVIKLTSATTENLKEMSQRQIMETYVFPEILLRSGSQTRGWTISNIFMDFASKHAEYCLKADPYTGGYLLEFALRRISCEKNFIHINQNQLPKEYKCYGVDNDKLCQMSTSCFDFLRKKSYLCSSLELTKKHLCNIIFGFLDNISSEGKLLNSFELKRTRFFKYNPKDVYDWAFATAKELYPKELYEFYATPERWEDQIDYFSSIKSSLDPKDFLDRIGVKGIFNRKSAWRLI